MTDQQLCGPFRLVRAIGRGGSGAVYLAERADGEVTQRVAIKLLRYGGDEPVFRERFLRERRILAGLSHPGIARLIDAGHTADGRPYLAMDYIDGTPIDVYAEKLDLPARLGLFLQVCDAVAYAHRNLIVHRDLKPSNILVDAAGRPKLLDFGIAKILKAGQDQTQTAEWQLTPEYASPEQVRGEAQTTATDVYSLGAVLDTLLAGRAPSIPRPPAPGPRPRSSLAPGLPKDLQFILGKALRPEPEERYPSVEALAGDVRAFLEGLPVRARQKDKWYRVRRFARRHRLAVAAAVLALAGLSMGLDAANRERGIAQRRFLQVRQLAGQFLDLDRGVRGLTGAAQARNRIVSDSLAYLAGLSAEAHGDRDLALEIGAAYLQVARIQGVPLDSHLGQFARAELNLRQADAFVETVLSADPANRRALSTAAQIAHDRMILALMQDRRQEALAEAGRMTTRVELLTGRGKLEPDEARDAAWLSRSVAFAREYRKAISGAAASSPRRTGNFRAAWGSNAFGELGNGASAGSLSGIVAVAGGVHHSLALKSDGTVWAWGDNSIGQLGIGSTTGRTEPGEVARLRDVVGIAHGPGCSLAVRADGTVWTWGLNVRSRPGDGISVDTLPIPVAGLNQVVAVAGGGGHALALKADGTVWAWGSNGNGQLGDGTGRAGDGPITIARVPVRVSGLSGVIAVAAGGAHSLAVKADGTVWAWGFNQYGQLGNGSNQDSYVPVRVPGLVGAIAVAGGDHYSLAVKSDGTVWAWGRNREGELGNGTNTESNLPVWVSDLSGVVAIAASPAQGPGHSLALKADGALWDWGYNAYGQLGDGGNRDSNVPVQVSGVRGAMAIAAGGSHSIAILAAPAR